MSHICLCVISGITNEVEMKYIKRIIQSLADSSDYGLKFSIDWIEPVVCKLDKNKLLISVQDSKTVDGCEMFLLPDDNIFYGYTNSKCFRERMVFLHQLSDIFLTIGYYVELYLGLSGTLPEEYEEFTVNRNNLIDLLSETVGIDGDCSVHINVK